MAIPCAVNYEQGKVANPLGMSDKSDLCWRFMNDPAELILSVAAFLLGACIGSFLNVCIYRWPIGLQVDKPARSFCPGCKRDIPMWQNIPLLSWLLLGGRCAGCKSRIAFRYFGVELLTALVYGGLWHIFPPGQAIAFAMLATSCIVTVFVDFEHYIIPHQVTWGFLPVGLLASALVPGLHLEDIWWHGLLRGLAGAAAGLGLLWLVVELGKRAFGRKTHNFSPAVAWEIREGTEAPELILGEETIPWDDVFSRKSDRLVIETTHFRLNREKRPETSVKIAWDHIELANAQGKSERIALADVVHLDGKTTRVVVPREAMGMGDVYFLGMAGAFVGWQGVLFTLFAASIYGTLFGLTVLLIGRRNWAGRIPFGPWLVAGLWTWILAGPLVLAWYFKLLGLENSTLLP